MIPEPVTLHHQFVERVYTVWKSHPDCADAVGDVGPLSSVMDGEVCMVMVASGPLMAIRFVSRVTTQWLFDCYGS